MSDRNSHGRRPLGQLHVWLGCLGLLGLGLILTGCSALRFSSSPPKAQVSSLPLTTGPTGPVTLPVLQAMVMRFADTYVATVAQACDESSARATNADARLEALRWKLDQATAAYNDATGPNPAVNALDMVVLVTMARNVIQDYAVPTYGDSAQPLLDAHVQLESNVWLMARNILKPSQEDELKNLIQEWRQKNPHQRYIGAVRFREFVAALGRQPSQTRTSPTSLFGLLYLDPLAGLDPTAAAIEQTRELGERAMYYSQRMPGLLNWQAQVLVYQVTRQPESQRVLNDADSLASSAALFAQSSQRLPQLINDQRQAAIQQILDGFASAGDRSRTLLTDARSTLNSANNAATNINAAIQSLAQFVRYVSPSNTAPWSAATNQPSFNVLDYEAAASQVAVAASNLNALLASLNQNAPEMEKLGRQMSANADQTMRHAFRLCLLLILIFLAGSLATALTYRILATSLANRHRRSDP